MDTPFLFYNFTDAVVKSDFCSPMPEEDDDDELFAELCRRLRLTSIFFDLWGCKTLAAPLETEPDEEEPEAISSVGRCCDWLLSWCIEKYKKY